MDVTDYPVSIDRISELYNGEIFNEALVVAARSRINWMCSQCEGETVLDVGCSQGIASILLAREGFTVTGLDPHPQAIKYAIMATKREAQIVQERLSWINSDLYSLDIGSKFDSIILGEVIEHQSLPRKFLSRTLQHLNEDGVIVITTPFGFLPHDDHKCTLFPSHLINILKNIGNVIISTLDTQDGYIRMTLQKCSTLKHIDYPLIKLIEITEQGAFDTQNKYYNNWQGCSLQLAKQKKVIESIKSNLTREEKNSSILKKELDKSKQVNTSLNEELDKSKQVNTSLNEELDKSKQVNTSLNEELDKSKQVNTSLNEELDKSKQVNTSLNEELDKSKQVNTSLNESISQRNAEYLSLNSMLKLIRQSSVSVDGVVSSNILKKYSTLSYKILQNNNRNIMENVLPKAIVRSLWKNKQKLSIEKIAEIYQQGGIAALIGVLNNLNISAENKAQIITSYAKQFNNLELQHIIRLARLAYFLDPKEFRAKWLVIQLIKAGKVHEPMTISQIYNNFDNLEFSDSEKRIFHPLFSLYQLMLSIPYHISLNINEELDPNKTNILYICANQLPYNVAKKDIIVFTKHLNDLITRYSSMIPVIIQNYPFDNFGKKNITSLDVSSAIRTVYNLEAQNYTNLNEYSQYLRNYFNNLINSNKINEVRVCSSYIHAVPALLAAKDNGIKFIYEIFLPNTITIFENNNKTEHCKLLQDFELVMALNADKVVVNSKKIKEYLIKNRVSAHKIVLLSKGEVPIDNNEQLQTNTINFIDLYQKHGIDGVLKFIKKSCNNDAYIAKQILIVGKILRENGFNEAEYPLYLNLLKFQPTLANLKGLFWASQRAGEYETSNKVISEIESLMLANQDIYDRGLLDKLKASPAYLLSILKHIKLKDTEKKIIFKTSRVCYVLHNSLPYSSGGYATRSHGVISGLKEAGYDVVVATRPGFPLDIKPELTAEQIPLIDIVDGTEYHRNLAIQRKNLTALSYMQQAADELEKQFVVLQPEIVMAASNHITGIPALIAARRLGIPFIYEVRGLWEITRLSRDAEFESKPAFKIQMLLEAACCKQADYVFTLTTPMKEELINRGVDSDKIEIIPNSCDPCRFIPTKKDIGLASKIGIPLNIPVIGYIGTFVDYEGLEDLAKACGLLKAQGQEFRLLLVGNENASGQDRGPITLEIERIAKECNFIDWLIMPGRVPHEDVESYYSLVDIAVFPRKPLPVCEMVSPMKPLEALAVEKAVLISSVRALAEMIQDGKTGLVFEKGNVFDLAEKLKLLMNDSSLRELLGKAGREWVKSHRTWTQVGERAKNILCNVVKSK